MVGIINLAFHSPESACSHFQSKKGSANSSTNWFYIPLNRRMPGSFDDSYVTTIALEEVLAQTQVNRRKDRVI